MRISGSLFGPSIHKTVATVYAKRMKIMIFFFGLIFTAIQGMLPDLKTPAGKVRYVALGDSYTICEGADPKAAWPVILTQHLNAAGISTELVANPSRTGWTTQNLIDLELPVFDQSNADFVTLCIGVNDWVQNVSAKSFEKNLAHILDHIQQKLSAKTKILLITIPDFSVTPQGALYTGGRDAAKGLTEFNNIILNEAKKRNLRTVDLFEVSKAMEHDGSLVADDGLHPSAKEYAIWETLIFPAAKQILK
jgi:lysophospholipase L1-like esterase